MEVAYTLPAAKKATINANKKVISKNSAPFTNCISLWQYCKDEPAVNNDGSLANFFDNNTTDSFKFKDKQPVKQVAIAQRMLKEQCHWNIWVFFEEPLQCH